MARDLVLYSSPLSGNAYKIRLLLAQLELPYRLETLDLLAGEVRADRFRALNPMGEIPFLVDDGFGLGESNAILLYLSRGTALCPEDSRLFAQTLQWMFFEQNQLELGIGVSRYMLQFMPEDRSTPTLVRVHRDRGLNALDTIERHFAKNDFAVGAAYSVADIALFGYAPLAPEGGFPLEPYPAVQRWLDRVRAQPRFIPMKG